MPKLTPEFTMWFDVPDDPDHGRIQIRHLLDGEVQEIVAQASDARTIWDEEAGAVRRETRHDLAKTASLTMDRAVAGWENFQDAAGGELPCTAANKARYAKEGWFIVFVAECRAKTAEAFAAAEEKRLGNSKALPSGSRGSGGKAARTAA